MNIIRRMANIFRGIGARRIVISASAALGPVLIALVVQAVLADRVELQRQRNKILKQEIAALDRTIANIGDLVDELTEYDVRREILRSTKTTIRNSVVLLADLSYLPGGVSLSNVTFDEEHLSLEGDAVDLLAIGHAADYLRQKKEIAKVVITDAERDANEVYRFVLAATIRNVSDADSS